MASRIGMSYRNEAAQGRIDAALAQLAENFGDALPAQPALTRDAVYNETLRLEWTADTLEAVQGILATVELGSKVSDADGPAEDETITGYLDAGELGKMKRGDLEDLARNLDIADPDDKSAYPNKEALIAKVVTVPVDVPASDETVDAPTDGEDAPEPDDESAQTGESELNPEAGK